MGKGNTGPAPRAIPAAVAAAAPAPAVEEGAVAAAAPAAAAAAAAVAADLKPRAVPAKKSGVVADAPMLQ